MDTLARHFPRKSSSFCLLHLSRWQFNLSCFGQRVSKPSLTVASLTRYSSTIRNPAVSTFKTKTVFEFLSQPPLLPSEPTIPSLEPTIPCLDFCNSGSPVAVRSSPPEHIQPRSQRDLVKPKSYPNTLLPKAPTGFPLGSFSPTHGFPSLPCTSLLPSLPSVTVPPTCPHITLHPAAVTFLNEKLNHGTLQSKALRWGSSNLRIQSELLRPTMASLASSTRLLLARQCQSLRLSWPGAVMGSCNSH